MELGVEEGKIHEGAAFDALRATQIAVKTLKTLQDQKAKMLEARLKIRVLVGSLQMWRHAEISILRHIMTTDKR
jgi:hypothetical protein